MRLISLQPECYYKSDKEPNYSIPLHSFGNPKFYHTHIVAFCGETSTSENPSDSNIHRITADRTDLCHANDKALIYASGGWFLKGKQAHNDAPIPLVPANFLFNCKMLKQVLRAVDGISLCCILDAGLLVSPTSLTRNFYVNELI